MSQELDETLHVARFGDFPRIYGDFQSLFFARDCTPILRVHIRLIKRKVVQFFPARALRSPRGARREGEGTERMGKNRSLGVRSV